MSKNDSSIALLPIRPNYVRAILTGNKKVEFRKKCFARPVKTIVIYATRPIKKIVAYFKISQIDVGKPEELWRQYQSVGGIAEEAYWSYFRNSKIAVAIRISDLKALKSPLGLHELIGTNVPPQSYSYLSKDTIKMISRLSKYCSNYA